MHSIGRPMFLLVSVAAPECQALHPTLPCLPWNWQHSFVEKTAATRSHASDQLLKMRWGMPRGADPLGSRPDQCQEAVPRSPISSSSSCLKKRQQAWNGVSYAKSHPNQHWILKYSCGLFQKWNLKLVNQELPGQQYRGNLPDRPLPFPKGNWLCHNQSAFC